MKWIIPFWFLKETQNLGFSVEYAFYFVKKSPFSQETSWEKKPMASWNPNGQIHPRPLQSYVGARCNTTWFFCCFKMLFAGQQQPAIRMNNTKDSTPGKERTNYHDMWYYILIYRYIYIYICTFDLIPSKTPVCQFHCRVLVQGLVQSVENS